MSRDDGKIFWTLGEWRAVVQDLARRNASVLAGGDEWLSTVSRIDLLAAMEATLPKSRVRYIGTNWRMKWKDYLVAAATYLRTLKTPLGKLPKTPEDNETLLKPLIKWNADDWQALVSALLASNPAYRADEFASLPFAEFKRVMSETLPSDRQRKFNAVTVVLPALRKALAAMPAPEPEPAPPHQDAPPAPAAVSVTNPEGWAATFDAKGDFEIESPPVPADDAQKKKVFTTAAEWVAIAEEIHRQNPHYGWPYKEHLAGLSVREVIDAMVAALPPERRRSITTVSPLRPHLIEAFKAVRARIEAEKAEREKAEQAEQERIAEIIGLAEHMSEECPVAPAPAPAAAPAVALPGNLTEQLVAALAPLARAIGEEFGRGFAAGFVPAIENSLLEVLAAAAPAVPSQSAPAAQAPEPGNAGNPGNAGIPASPAPDADPFEYQPPPHYAGPEGIKPRAPRIAVIGPQAIGRELENAFPDVEFTMIERAPKGIPEAIAHCDRIIGIDNFTTDAAKIAIKRTPEGKSKFVPVHGGTSSVKRQINLWITSGTLRVTH